MGLGQQLSEGGLIYRPGQAGGLEDLTNDHPIWSSSHFVIWSYFQPISFIQHCVITSRLNHLLIIFPIQESKVREDSHHLFICKTRQEVGLESLTMHWQEDDRHQGVIMELSTLCMITHLLLTRRHLRANFYQRWVQNMQKPLGVKIYYFVSTFQLSSSS